MIEEGVTAEDVLSDLWVDAVVEGDNKPPVTEQVRDGGSDGPPKARPR